MKWRARSKTWIVPDGNYFEFNRTVPAGA